MSNFWSKHVTYQERDQYLVRVFLVSNSVYHGYYSIWLEELPHRALFVWLIRFSVFIWLNIFFTALEMSWGDEFNYFHYISNLVKGVYGKKLSSASFVTTDYVQLYLRSSINNFIFKQLWFPKDNVFAF